MVSVSPFGELDVVDGVGQRDALGLGEQQHQAAGDERQGSCGQRGDTISWCSGEFHGDQFNTGPCIWFWNFLLLLQKYKLMYSS